MRTSLVTDAIEMALAARGGQSHGVVFHTDRGAQYGSAAFAEVCRQSGIRRSMGRVGSSYDSALTESFFQGRKRVATAVACVVSSGSAKIAQPGRPCLISATGGAVQMGGPVSFSVTLECADGVPSYFSASCGGAPLAIVRQYIEQHKRPL